MPQLPGTQCVDANNRQVTAPWLTQVFDAAGASVNSPLAATTTPAPIAVPKNAVYMYVVASALARWGFGATLDGSAAAKAYGYAPANAIVKIPVSNLAGSGSVYLASDVTTANIAFWFEMLGA